MHKYIIICLFLLFSLTGFGQKKGKPKVIVYGQGDAAFASALQASASGVSTLWVIPEGTFQSNLEQGLQKGQSNSGSDAGLWPEFLKASVDATTLSDSVINLALSQMNPQVARNTFTKMIDSSKNLQVVYNTNIRKIKKSGKRWKVGLSDGDSHKVFSLIDANEQPHVLRLIREEDRKADSILSRTSIPLSELYQSALYKTSLMVLENDGDEVIPAEALIRPVAENIFSVYGNKSFPAEVIDKVPEKFLAGQSLGAVAAYCAFFETTADKINLRTLQGELLAFKVELIPFSDISFEDADYMTIQRIGMTGIFKGRVDGGELFFDADNHVSSSEIRPVIESIYTRSQIWFRDKSIEALKLNEFLDLVKFIALRGDELNTTVEKGWKEQFDFTGNYDPECMLSRRQVAVLIDHYLKPFQVKVQKNGEFRY